MRNILEYPITQQEVVEAVNRAGEAHRQSEQIGGIDGYALHLLVKFLQQESVQIQLAEYLKRECIK